jgi:hypothetical protein
MADVNGDHSQSSGLSKTVDAELMKPFSGVCTISAKTAVLIYLANKEHASRRGDGLAISLAEKFGITAKAVRDIWSLRSWAATTRPHWTPEVHEKFMRKKLCASCRSNGVTSFERACAQCKARKPRGLPFSTPPASSSSSTALRQESSENVFDINVLPHSPSHAPSRACSGVKTPSPAAQVQRSSRSPGKLVGAIAAAQEHQASPSYSGSLSGSASTRPTNQCHTTSHQVDEVFVEDTDPKSSKDVTRSDFDRGTQQQSAGNDDGLETGNDTNLLWLVPADEIAQHFSEILSSWEATMCV